MSNQSKIGPLCCRFGFTVLTNASTGTNTNTSSMLHYDRLDNNSLSSPEDNFIIYYGRLTISDIKSFAFRPDGKAEFVNGSLSGMCNRQSMSKVLLVNDV